MKRIAWRILMILPLLAYLVFMQPRNAFAQTLVVNPGGGGYATIQSAIRHAQPGDVIHIKSGTYTDAINLSEMGADNSGGVLLGNLSLVAIDGAGTAIISGAGLTDGGTFGYALTIDGLKFQNTPADAIQLTSFTDLIIVNSTFTQVGTGSGHDAVDLAPASGTGTITLYNNTLSDAREEAIRITLSGSSNYTTTLKTNTINDPTSGGNKPISGVVFNASGTSQAHLTIRGGSIAGLRGGGPGISLNVTDSARLYGSIHGVSISNLTTNTTTPHSAAAIQVTTSSTASVPTSLDITNNTIGAILNGAGIRLTPQGSARLSARIVENTISAIGVNAADGTVLDRGIDVSTDSAFTGQVDLAVFTNTLNLIDSSAIALNALNSGQFNAAVWGNTTYLSNRTSDTTDAAFQVNAQGAAGLILDLKNNEVQDPDRKPNYLLTEGTGANFQVVGTLANMYTANKPDNTDSTDWSVSSGVGENATYTPPAVNRPPVAVDDALTAVATTPTTFLVQSNDSDPESNPRSLNAVTPISAKGGTAALSGPALTYTSPTNYITSDTLYYVASDGQATDVAKVTVTVQPYPSPDLVISKTHVGDFMAGGTGQYTVVVSNIGNQPTTAGNTVTVVDSLPISLTLTSMSGTGWTCTSNSCTRTDSLATGASYDPIILQVYIQPGAPAQLVNTASVSYDGEYNNTNNFASDTTAVLQPDLTIDKSHVGDFREGQVGAMYTLHVSNVGAGSTTGLVQVSDTLPAGLTPTGFSGSTTPWTCTISGQLVSCQTTQPLAAGSSFTDINVLVTVADNTPAQLTNMASVSGGGEVNLDNNVDYDPTNIAQVPNLSITKTMTPAAFYQGQTGAVFTLSVANPSDAGPTDGTTVTISDTLPSGMSTVVGNITVTDPSNWTCTVSGRRVQCATNAGVVLPAGYTAAVNIQASVSTTAGTPLSNTATVYGGGELASSLGNNRSTLSVTVNGTPNLQIFKSHSPSRFVQGGTGTFTLNVRNQSGARAATDGTTVTVSDTLPAGVTILGVTPPTGWSCSTVGQLVQCTTDAGVTLGTSYNQNISISVSVSKDATSPLRNAATVSGGGDIYTSDNRDTDSVGVDPLPYLTVDKSHTGDFLVGQANATFTLVVTNNGHAATSTTVATVISDTLPVGLTYVSATGTGWTCGASGQLVTCSTLTSLAVGASSSPIALVVSVDSSAVPSVSNTAEVSGGGQVYQPYHRDTDVVNVYAPIDLAIAKSYSGPFYQGQTSGAYFTLHVTNGSSGSTSSTVTISDTLPAGLSTTVGSVTAPTGWTCTVSGQLVQCTTNTGVVLPGGYAADIVINVSVDSRANDYLSNTATVSGGGELSDTLGNNRATLDNIRINGMADLTVVKSHTPDSFRQGLTGTYTLTVSNIGRGASDGTTVTISDTLPAGLSTVVGNITAPTGWSCTVSGQLVQCTTNAGVVLGVDYTANIVMTVNVDSNAGNDGLPLTNTVEISGGADVYAANNRDSDDVIIYKVANLTVVKTHTDPFIQGQVSASYLITVTNTGNGPTDAPIVVTDTLDSSLTFTGYTPTLAQSPAGWSCTLVSPPANTVVCTRASALAAGGKASLTLFVNVAKNAPASFVNTVKVGGGGESDTGDNEDTDPTTVTQMPDLTIDKSHSGNFYQGQSGATYNITVSNVGYLATSGTITVTDALPPSGFTVTGMSGTGWNCNPATLTCTRSDSLAPSLSYPAITLTVDVSTTAASPLVNTASVKGTDSDLSNNSDADSTVIEGRFDLAINKTSAGSFRQGGTGEFYLDVSNVGGAATTGVIMVTDVLSTGLTPTGPNGASGEWTCAVSGQTVTCTTSTSLASGASFSRITIPVNVAPDAGNPLNNTAVVTASGEVNTANNSDTVTINTIQAANLVVDKSHTGVFRQGLTGAVYSIQVTNVGTGATDAPIVLTDTLPTGLTATAFSGTGWSCSLSPLRCTRTTALAAGASSLLTLTVDVAKDAPAQVTNHVVVAGGGEAIIDGDNDDDDLTDIVQYADLTITKTHTGSFIQGQTNAQYTLTITNVGRASTTATVVVQDMLPAGLTATQISGVTWTCDPLPNLRCTNSGVLAPNTSYPPIVVTVSVNNDAPASVRNMATVSGGGQIVITNDTAFDDTTIIQRANLLLSKVVYPTQAVPGQKVDYTLKVTNDGMGLATNIVLTDILPTAFQVSAVSSEGVQFVDTGHVPAYVWQVGDLAQGKSGTLHISGAFAPGTLPQVFTNQALVTTSAVEADGTDNTALASLTITKANSQTSLVATPDNPVEGQTVILTATVQTVAPGIGLPTGWITFTHGTTFLETTTLDASGKVVLPISGLAPGPHTFTASYGGDALHYPSSTTINNFVRPQSDLGIGLTVDPNSTLTGRNVTYRISATNYGPTDATNVLASLQLPLGFSFVSAGSSAGCALQGGQVACQVSSLAVGANLGFDVVVNVTTQSNTGLVTATASITSDSADLTTTNNTAQATVNVIGMLNSYFNNFEQPVGSEWCVNRRDTTPIGQRQFLGQFGNETACLDLQDLSAHSSIQVEFDLYLINTWNGNFTYNLLGNDLTLAPDGESGPDRWKLEADGQVLLDTTYALWKDNVQSFPAWYKQGSFPRFTGAAENRTLGYYYADKPMDAVYHLIFVFPHSASTLNLDFTGLNLQSIENESWGLDNVSVTLFGQVYQLYLPALDR